jgi:hypothetical protein
MPARSHTCSLCSASLRWRRTRAVAISSGVPLSNAWEEPTTVAARSVREIDRMSVGDDGFGGRRSDLLDEIAKADDGSPPLRWRRG